MIGRLLRRAVSSMRPARMAEARCSIPARKLRGLGSLAWLMTATPIRGRKKCTSGAKARTYFQRLNGTAEESAEKVIPDREPCPQRLKPNSKQGSYRSGEPLHPITPKVGVLGAAALRHPKASCATQNQVEHHSFRDPPDFVRRGGRMRPPLRGQFLATIFSSARNSKADSESEPFIAAVNRGATQNRVRLPSLRSAFAGGGARATRVAGRIP
jgi:hypothetical protein